MAASELRAVINAMLQVHRELQEVRKARAKQLGLNEEALASYEAVAGHHNDVYRVDLLRDLIHDVLQTVKRVLRKRDVRAEDFETLVERIMEQAEALYADWPAAA